MTSRRIAGALGFAWILLLLSGAATFVDPDAWHLMALAREAIALGQMPLTDRFAYTPTIHPVVQHEWGSGMLLYFLATHGGLVALQLARGVLIAALVLLAVHVARRRGATTATLVTLAPFAIVMTWITLTALRPQLLTIVFLAAWLALIEMDRRGDRRWIPLALVGHVLWLNLHAGFVVGMAFLTLHGLEQALRGRPFLHVAGTVGAMALLVAINPYGLDYYQYLAKGLTMARPLIGEWKPIWQAHPAGFGIYVLSLLIALAATAQLGVARAPGLPILAAAAYLAASAERHVSIHALVWFAYVPALVAGTRLGGRIQQRLEARPGPALQATIAVAVGLSVVLFASQRPWRLIVPGTLPSGAPAPYPVGPADYLDANRTTGNLLVPFGVGAFVSWKLHPRIKVSLDTRYEVAYPPELLVTHLEFYAGRPGWRTPLEGYPTDLVLAPAKAPVVELLATQTNWTVVYRDDAYLLFAKPGLALPVIDRRGDRIVGTFP